jgi:MFS family permease
MSEQSQLPPRSIAKGHPRLLFATLMLGQMSQSLVFTAFIAALPQMAKDLGIHGPFVAQMTMAFAALGLMLGSIVSGWILEKVGTRATMLASMLIFAFAGAAGLVLRNPALLLASRFILGFVSACMGTTCLWGMAAEYAGNKRAKTLGISAAVANCTALISTILGGYIAQRGWPLTFLQYPVFGLIGCVLIYASLRQVRPERELAGETSQPFLKRLLPFYLLVVVLFAVMFLSSTQFAFVMEDEGIRNPATRSLIMSAITVLAALMSFCYGPVQQRLGVLGTFTFGTSCMALALAAVGWGTNPAYLVVGAALMGLYVGVLGPYIYHVVSEQTDSFTRSRAIGLLGAFGYLGGFLNPVMFAPLGDAIGMRNVFLAVSFAMAVLSLLTATRLVRRRAAMRVRAASP